MLKKIKWLLLFLLAFPYAAYGRDTTMESWVKEKFGIQVPHLEISQTWNVLPIISGCQYEWYICSSDAKFQIKDNQDNFYRIYYQNDTLTVDFKKDFWGLWGG